MLPKRVLVIDDDDSIREVLDHLLRAEGLEVQGAIDGKQGIEKLPVFKPGLIVLDLMMPRMSGFEVLQKLQEEGWTKVPVIVITGRYQDPSNEASIRLESNVVEFLRKPVRYADLASLIRRLYEQPRPDPWAVSA